MEYPMYLLLALGIVTGTEPMPPLVFLLFLAGFLLVAGLAVAGFGVLLRALDWFDDWMDERREKRVDEQQGLRRAKK